MNQFLENMTGMNVLNDQAIANDFLISAKTGVRNLAYAITETASPELRKVLRKHLEEAITTHEKAINYMLNQNWYPAYNVDQLVQMDINTSQQILKLQ